MPHARPPRNGTNCYSVIVDRSLGGPTSCHKFVVYQRHYRRSRLMLIRRAFVAWELNGDTRDVDILHSSASTRAEHTLGL
ncbi:hypothetical protein K439DRAFT_1637687 [Ramaria rubella]|nr:hypothetical protein K439DRAFT_1637687 [Ramaria rubella]